MLTIKDVDDVLLAFPAKVVGVLLPLRDEIPQVFFNGNTKWNRVVHDWFYSGLKNAKWKPKPGVDEQKALRMVSACMKSYEPEHNHKTAGCAYMLSEFFDDVTYDRAD